MRGMAPGDDARATVRFRAPAGQFLTTGRHFANHGGCITGDETSDFSSGSGAGGVGTTRALSSPTMPRPLPKTTTPLPMRFVRERAARTGKNPQTGQPLTEPNQKGVLTIAHPLPPGCLQTVWGDDDRFVRTAYYLDRLEKPKDLRGAIAGIVSVLRSAAQPYGKADPNRPNISPTLWRTVVDHTNLSYYFELTDSPYITWVELRKFNLSDSSNVMMLDIEGDRGLMGDVSAKFTEAEPFKFVLP